MDNRIESDTVDKLIQVELKKLAMRKNLTLRKEFKLTTERLQDDGELALQLVREYLLKYSDRIEKFWFESYVDESTFSPVLVLIMLPIKSIRKHMRESVATKLLKK